VKLNREGIQRNI